MLIHQFEVKGLSHYSYAVGCKEACEVAIIDPERNIYTYIEFAAKNRLKIKYVVETHIHADYASGAKELAQKTGAELMLSSYDTGEKYSYEFPHAELNEGDVMEVGEGKLKVLHTPGHTPEHISFLLYDNNKGSEPVAMFSGDFLFVGSVGRPDLLGEQDKTPLARQLYKSLQNLKNLPDSLEIYPSHGAGSLCGAGLGSSKYTTLGEERETNPYLLEEYEENEFVEKVLSTVPPFPDYYIRMKEMNSKGPGSLEGVMKVESMDVEAFSNINPSRNTILDVRHPLFFGGGNIEGSLNIGMPDQLSFWAGWVVPADKPIYLVLDDEEKLNDYIHSLTRVGLDNIKGYLRGGFNAWVSRGQDFTDVPQISVHGLNDFLEVGDGITVLDVRSDNEWEAGHIKNARHIYLGDLPKAKNIAAKEDAIFCICGGGYRSSIAASILQRQGYENIYNVYGGMGAWKNAHLPVQVPKPKAEKNNRQKEKAAL